MFLLILFLLCVDFNTIIAKNYSTLAAKYNFLIVDAAVAHSCIHVSENIFRNLIIYWFIKVYIDFIRYL